MLALNQRFFLMLTLLASSCRPSHEEEATTSAGDTSVAWNKARVGSNAIREPDKLKALMKPNLYSAIEYALPFMTDEAPLSGPQVRDARLGAMLMRLWGQQHLGWGLLDATKDVDLDEIGLHAGRFRGTLVCVRGVLSSRDSSTAVLVPQSGDDLDAPRAMRRQARILLTHVDSSPRVGDSARACGVFTGLFTDLREGAIGAVVVGMLDTPDNRVWIPPAPRSSGMERGRPEAPRAPQNLPL